MAGCSAAVIVPHDRHGVCNNGAMSKRTFFVYLAALVVMACSPLAVADNSMAGFCKNLPRPEYATLARVPHHSEWFELYQVAPDVIAIYEPHQWQEVISYLIEGSESALLFDTGNGIADIAKLVRGLTDKPVSVLNSHTHYDHVGGNHAFDKVYGMNTDFTRRRQSGHSNSDIKIEVSAQALCKPLPEGVSEDTHVGQPFTVTHTLEDGSVIDLGDRQLEVLHVPGHTPDSVVLIDRAAGLMWTGDSYYSGPIWLFAQETDLVAYQETLDRLISELPNINALLPAHNTPWVRPNVLVRVKKAFVAMLSGQTVKQNQGTGMVEHTWGDEKEFSFLMRDEALPYAK